MSEEEKNPGIPEEMAETTDLPPDAEIQEEYANMVQQETDAPNQVTVAAPAADPRQSDGRRMKISCHNCGQKVDLTSIEAFSVVLCPSCGTELIVPKWFGNYLLEEICGIGGMATVYRALDMVLDREVAIKVLKDELAADMAISQIFLHEARTAATITHASVIPIYTCGVTDGQNYIVMQYMGGGSLESILKEAEEPLPVYNVVEWIRDVASGLENASRYNVIHHDIKPANIMLDVEGKAKIGDFGIAQIANRDKGLASEVRAWVSPDYVSPEKVRDGDEDYRGDIYSLGATFYHVVTGMTPFSNSDLDELLRARLVAPPMAPNLHRQDIPARISDLILAMMSIEPEQRPSYQKIIAVLNEYLDNPNKFSGDQAAKKPLGLKKTPGKRPVAQRKPAGARPAAQHHPHTSSVQLPQRKKQSPFLSLVKLVCHLIVFLISLTALLFLLDHFRRIDMLTEYMPEFMQIKKKSTKAEAPLNTSLIYAFQSGYPDDVIKRGDEYLREPSKARRLQGILQVCYAQFLNNSKTAREYCKTLLKSLDKSLTYCDKIVYEDNLLIIAYLADEIHTPSEVYKNFRFYKDGKPVCGSDFEAKLALATLFRSFLNNTPAFNEQVEMLNEMRRTLDTLRTEPNWVFDAFNDRYLYWQQAITKKKGKRAEIEELFQLLIEAEGDWEFPEPAKKAQRFHKPGTVGGVLPEVKKPVKVKVKAMKEEQMMSNVAKLEVVAPDFTPTAVDTDVSIPMFDQKMLADFLEEQQKKFNRPRPQNPFSVFNPDDNAEKNQYLNSLKGKDAENEKAYVERLWKSFKPMPKREIMFKPADTFKIDNAPFIFKDARFKLIEKENDGSTGMPFILRVQRRDGAYVDYRLEDCPYETCILLLRAYAKERSSYTFPKVNANDAAMKHAVRLEQRARAFAYLSVAHLYAWYGDSENCYEMLKKAVGESLDGFTAKEIKNFLLPPAAQNPQKSKKK